MTTVTSFGVSEIPASRLQAANTQYTGCVQSYRDCINDPQDRDCYQEYQTCIAALWDEYKSILQSKYDTQAMSYPKITGPIPTLDDFLMQNMTQAQPEPTTPPSTEFNPTIPTLPDLESLSLSPSPVYALSSTVDASTPSPMYASTPSPLL